MPIRLPIRWIAYAKRRRRRSIQMAYNEEHGIVPQTVKKGLSDITDYLESEEGKRSAQEVNADLAGYSRSEILRVIASLEDEMMEASAAMDFERVASVRDRSFSCVWADGRQSGSGFG